MCQAGCLNPLSIGSVFPTNSGIDTISGTVLIPFLSGLFFQLDLKLANGELTEVLIPFLSGLFFQPATQGNMTLWIPVLIPFLSGLFFQRRYSCILCRCDVLIPFLSGLFFQLEKKTIICLKMRLNPLSIGSVFPTATIKKDYVELVS